MSDRTITNLLRGTVVAGVLGALTGLTALIWTDEPTTELATLLTVIVAMTVSFGVVAWIAAGPQPRNSIVWILAAFVAGLGAYGVGRAVMAAIAPGVPLPLDVETQVPAALPSAVAWLEGWTNAIATIGQTSLLTFGLLLFPDGRLPSRRWRPVGFLLILGILSAGISNVLVWNPANTVAPFAPDGPGHDFVIGNLFIVLGPLVSLAGLAVRFRRSESSTRSQIKWIIWGAGILVPSMLVGSVAGIPLLSLTGALIFVAAYGVAITKYRLYDIDLVISRTLVYGALALFIGAVYVGVVVITGSTVASGDSPNAVVTIAATALIAAAFQPLRRRLERLASRLVYGKKATPYEVLSEFSQRVAATDEGLVDEVVESLVGGTGAETAAIWVADRGRWHRTAVFPADTPSTVSPKPNADPSNDKVVVPVEHDGETLGLVVLDSPSGQRLSDEDRTLATQVASGMGLALHNQQLTDTLRRRVDELRDSRRRIVAVQDETRRTLERNLHDGAQQQLVALKVKLGLAKRMALADHAPQTEEMLEELSTESDAAIEAMRSFARGIYPPLLEAEGLEAALQAQARRVLVPVELSVDGIGRYDRDTEATVYFCVLEALRNASKHAAAAAVEVSLAQFNGRVRFDVVDDGVGFDPDQAFAQGSGLTHMADRLDALGGELTIHSAPGEATRLEGQLPAVPAGRIGVSA